MRRNPVIEIPEEQKTFYIKTARVLKGSERRIFMASIVQALGRGGQRYVEQAFGWNRRTVRKGMEELTSGISKIDQFAVRGRKRAEERLPHLLDDLREIIDGQRQISASLGTSQVNTHLSAATVRRQLFEQKAYPEERLPCIATINKKLKELGYHRRAMPKNSLKEAELAVNSV
ncbi:MAG: hypothetical protein NT075_19310 [Chloroflexi bacterium]|nr:hypothetical protein [Chloroflexota bacterium]